jgi:hypothetical protein
MSSRLHNTRQLSRKYPVQTFKLRQRSQRLTRSDNSSVRLLIIQLCGNISTE